MYHKCESPSAQTVKNEQPSWQFFIELPNHPPPICKLNPPPLPYLSNPFTLVTHRHCEYH